MVLEDGKRQSGQLLVEGKSNEAAVAVRVPK
jgi:hypothetical protein